jgi:hypothetical protein
LRTPLTAIIGWSCLFASAAAGLDDFAGRGHHRTQPGLNSG